MGALIACPNCGHSISDNAYTCPKCNNNVVRCRICDGLVAQQDLIYKSYAREYHRKCMHVVECFDLHYKCPICGFDLGSSSSQEVSSPHYHCPNCGDGRVISVKCCGKCDLPIFCDMQRHRERHYKEDGLKKVAYFHELCYARLNLPTGGGYLNILLVGMAVLVVILLLYFC